MHDPDWFYAFVPGGPGRGPRSRPPRPPACARRSIRQAEHREFLLGLRHLPVHPQRRGGALRLRAGLRLLRCRPRFLLATTAATLGALLALYVPHGLGCQLGGWLLIHGVTELLRRDPGRRGGLPDRLGRGLPGRRTRLEAAAAPAAGRASVMAGVIVMLFSPACWRARPPADPGRPGPATPSAARPLASVARLLLPAAAGAGSRP